MKLFFIFLLGLLATVPPLGAQQNGIDQDSELLIVPAGDKFLRWHGEPGRTYFMQISSQAEPLARWTWAPIIESGSGVEISHEIGSTGARGFFRLQYTDQVPPPGVTLEEWDSDGDGMPNAWELANGLSPLDTTGENGAGGDLDNDGVDNGSENQGGTSPNDPAGFPLQMVSVSRGADGNFNSAGSIIHWSQHWGEDSGISELLNVAVSPGTLAQRAATNQFPDTPPIDEPGVETANYGLSSPSAFGRFLLGSESDTGEGNLNQTRCWVRSPPVPHARTFKAVELTSTTSALGQPTSTTSTTAGVVEFTIQADTQFSNEIDLEPLPTASPGVQTTVSKSILAIAVKPALNMAGVVGDMIPSNEPASTELHFVTPKETTEIPDDHVIFEATGITAEQITPGDPAQVVEWTGGEAVPAEPLKRRVKRDTTGKTVVIIQTLQDHGGEEVVKLNVWVVWSTVTPRKGTAIFHISDAGWSKYLVPATNEEAWKFVFSLQPDQIITDPERPALSGYRTKDVPGAGKPHVDLTILHGDAANYKWDVSRQLKVTTRNPNSIPKLDLDQIDLDWVFVNQPKDVDVPLDFPIKDNEGNDDPPILDEDSNPYEASVMVSLEHAVGELSSFDAPGLWVLDSWGQEGRRLTIEFDFQEFARVELWDRKRESGKFWFRISDFHKWHHAMRTQFNGSSGDWANNGSTSDNGHSNP